MNKMNEKEFIGKVAFNVLQIVRKYNNEDQIENWNDLNQERKNQVLKTVEAVFNNPKITAYDMHDEWEKSKLDNGWKYAPVTDRSKKLHSCLVPFEALNIFQKMKDDIFIETVKQLISLEVDELNDFDNFNTKVLKESNRILRSTNNTLELTNEMLSGDNNSLRKNNRILLNERIEYMEITEKQRKMIIQLKKDLQELRLIVKKRI